MKFSHILWDFNGTILDDVGIGIDAVNGLLRSRNLPPLRDREEYRRHFRFPVKEYYKSVGFDFDKDSYDVLAREWVDRYRALESAADLRDGAKEALAYIRKQKIPQILFSATRRQMLLQQVARLGLDGWFDEILGTDNIYAEGKISLGKAWVDAVRPACALLIGDTEHDGVAARRMGVECVLIAGGHQSAKALESTGFPVLNDLLDLPWFLENSEKNSVEKEGCSREIII